jgi:hypothetical protein
MVVADRESDDVFEREPTVAIDLQDGRAYLADFQCGV